MNEENASDETSGVNACNQQVSNNNFRKLSSSQSSSNFEKSSEFLCCNCKPSPAETLNDCIGLKEELLKAQSELRLKEEECKKLTRDQMQTGEEVVDLTASLFEEANSMVQDANIKRIAAEKLLREANTKIEILQAEVTALKTLVITSTPSRPNPHLNPQIDKAKKTEFIKGHRRSTSHHSIVKDIIQSGDVCSNHPIAIVTPRQHLSEMDPARLSHFRQWKLAPNMDTSSTFLSEIIQEDLLPCLYFPNKELSKMVYDGIFCNTLTIEPLVPDKSSINQHCMLSDAAVLCTYCIKLGERQMPYVISQMARNRIIAVCDFVTYLRYITLGLVKSDDNEIYREILRHRKRMCLARLGLDE